MVGDLEAASGRIDVAPDLAPLALIGIGPRIAVPDGVVAGDVVAVRLEDAAARRIRVAGIDVVPRRPRDERALIEVVVQHLGQRGGPRMAPPIADLATLVASIAAVAPGVLRSRGRPLSEVLRGAGFEVHLGWVGARGTSWSHLTEAEIDTLEVEVAALLASERIAEAAETQERLTALLARHLPERLPAARRHLARLLARAGDVDRALGQLRPAFRDRDPEDWYEAALIAYRSGDTVSARRWTESGLAHATAPERAEVAECLDDIAGDLDAQAAFLRLRASLEDEDRDIEPERDGIDRVVRALTGLERSYLVEAMAEGIVDSVPPEEIGGFLAAVAEVEDGGRDACLALSTVAAPGRARTAREGPARTEGGRARPAIAGLVGARPVAAWATSPLDAPDQQQVVITIAKERGRLSPLVVLVDLGELGGGVKDAFFLPDMIEPRLRRELFAPMEEVGLPSAPVDTHEAIALVAVALERTAAIGWRIPSLQHQPVLDRIERWLLRPRRGGTGRSPVTGG